MNERHALRNTTRIWHQLEPNRKLQLYAIICLMIISSLVEVFSIGSVIPFIGVLVDPEKVFEHPHMEPLIRYFSISEPAEIIIPIAVVFCFGAIASGFLRIMLLVVQTRVTYSIGVDLSVKIFERTLNQPYVVHISRNSSEVISGVSVKANELIVSLLYPTAILVSSLIMLAIVLIALVMLNPTITMVTISAFALFYGLVLILFKKRLRRISSTIAIQYQKVIKLIQEGLGGIRDILLDGTQRTFVNNYYHSESSLRTSRASLQIISGMPRYIIETLGTLLIVGVAIYLTKGGDGLHSALPVLGVMGLAAQRLTPIIQQIYSSWTAIEGGRTSVNDALDLLEQVIPVRSENTSMTDSLPFESSIKLERVSFRYSSGLSEIIKDLNLTIVKGARIGVIGETGSGKSTLLDIIMGMLVPTNGNIRIDNCILTADTMTYWQDKIAHVPQSIYLADSTITENIAFGFSPNDIDHERVIASAKTAQIHEVIQEMSMGYDTVVGERGVRLSGGQRQRIGIARAIYKQASVIVLDEATSALDKDTEELVMNAIHALPQKITLIIVAHRHSTLKQCTGIIQIKKGMISEIGIVK